MGMEGFKFEPGKKIEATLEQNDEGGFDISGLDHVMANEVRRLRENNAEINAALEIIEKPEMPRGMKRHMKAYLEELEPNFNWGLHLDLEDEEDPTIH